MTAFVPSDLPAEVNTVEKLHVWASSVLGNLYTDATVIEAPGTGVRVVSCGPYLLTAETPSTWRFISRLTLALDKNWVGANNQLWNSVQEIGQAPIPVSFKS
jgi:hypothetical protein